VLERDSNIFGIYYLLPTHSAKAGLALEATNVIYCFANLILRDTSFAGNQNLFAWQNLVPPTRFVVSKNKLLGKMFIFSTLVVALCFSGDYNTNSKVTIAGFVSKK